MWSEVCPISSTQTESQFNVIQPVILALLKDMADVNEIGDDHDVLEETEKNQDQHLNMDTHNPRPPPHPVVVRLDYATRP